MNFNDQYKHPHWQRKRLEVLDAKGFYCSVCGSEDETIHVHHKRYVKGRKIWEYHVDEFDVLCASCHKEAHKAKDVMNEVIARAETPVFLEISALIFEFVGAFVHPDDPIEKLLKESFPALYKLGEFASLIEDFSTEDIHTILSLDPDEFRSLAAYLRAHHGKG